MTRCIITFVYSRCVSYSSFRHILQNDLSFGLLHIPVEAFPQRFVFRFKERRIVSQHRPAHFRRKIKKVPVAEDIRQYEVKIPALPDPEEVSGAPQADTSDASVVAIATVACIALAGIVVAAKKSRR